MFKLFKIFVAACFCALSLMCLAGVFIAENAPEHVKEKSRSEREAKEFAREWVLSKLKYPETADFVWGSTQVREYPPIDEEDFPGLIGVTGKVRSKNAFGTELLYSYEVKTWMNEPTKVWTARIEDQSWPSPEYRAWEEKSIKEIAELKQAKE